MYKVQKITLFVLFSITIIATIALDLKINKEFATSIITTLAIICGFYATSIAIIFSSSNIGRLYGEQDPNKPSNTRLQTLRDFIRYGALSSFTTIIIYCIFLLCEPTYHHTTTIGKLSTYALVLAAEASFYLSFVLFNTMLAFMLQEGLNQRNRQ